MVEKEQYHTRIWRSRKRMWEKIELEEFEEVYSKFVFLLKLMSGPTHSDDNNNVFRNIKTKCVGGDGNGDIRRKKFKTVYK